MRRLLPKTFKFRTMLGILILLILLCILYLWNKFFPSPMSPGEYAGWYGVFPACVIWSISLIICTWRKYRKEGVPFREIPAQTYNDFEAIKVLSAPLQKIVCPYCNNVFKLPIRIQPFKVTPSKAVCPKCGEKSILMWDSFHGFQIRRKQQGFGLSGESFVEPINNLIDVCCPYCNNTFQIPQQEKPFRIKCPKCGKESRLK